MTTRTPAPGRPHLARPAESAALLPSAVGGIRALAAAAAVQLALARTAWRAVDPIDLVPRVLQA